MDFSAFCHLIHILSLVSSFCTLGQMFAADFFQIPTHDGHPCLSGYTIPTIRARWGLAPVRHYSSRAYKKDGKYINLAILLNLIKQTSMSNMFAENTANPET